MYFIRGDNRKWWNANVQEENENVKWLVGWNLANGAGNNEIMRNHY